MKAETKEILEKLGFKNLTGNLWKHKTLKLTKFFDDETEPFDIAIDIFDGGKLRMREEIKAILDIK